MKGTWRGILFVILIAVLSCLVIAYFSTTAGTDREPIMSKEEQQETRLTNQIFAIANKILKEKGYKSNFMSIEVNFMIKKQIFKSRIYLVFGIYFICSISKLICMRCQI